MWKFIARLFGWKVTSKEKKEEDKLFVGTVTIKEEVYKGVATTPATCFEVLTDDGSTYRGAIDMHRVPINVGDRIEMRLSDKSCVQKPETKIISGEDGVSKVADTNIIYYRIDEYRILPEESEEEVGDMDLGPSDMAEHLQPDADRVLASEEHEPS